MTATSSPRAEQRVDEVRADEAGAAGDEGAHGGRSSYSGGLRRRRGERLGDRVRGAALRAPREQRRARPAALVAEAPRRALGERAGSPGATRPSVRRARPARRCATRRRARRRPSPRRRPGRTSRRCATGTIASAGAGAQAGELVGVDAAGEAHARAVRRARSAALRAVAGDDERQPGARAGLDGDLDALLGRQPRERRARTRPCAAARALGESRGRRGGTTCAGDVERRAERAQPRARPNALGTTTRRRARPAAAASSASAARVDRAPRRAVAAAVQAHARAACRARGSACSPRRAS